MKHKTISNTGFSISELGLGCMGMSEYYGSTNEAQSIETINLAIEKGITHFDTADVYGCGANEVLVGKALKAVRDKITIATKFGIVRDNSDLGISGMNGSPENAIKACNESLKRLGTDYIDLFYLHRLDYNVPIEETVYAMSKLVKEGKVRYIGLSEAGCESIKKAHAVHPITAIQSEYSLWTREPETEIFPLCKELGIGFIPYSPLGRGFFTGKIDSINVFEDNDFRKVLPRLQEENIKHNLWIVDKLKEISARKNCTPVQVALAWIMSKGDFIVPIFGTKRPLYLLENLGASDVILTESDIKELESVATLAFANGARIPEKAMEIFKFTY